MRHQQRFDQAIELSGRFPFEISATSSLGTLRVLVWLSLGLALVNHLLPPTPYAATQLLLNYDFGFVRRGLAGELLGYIWPDRVRIPHIYLTTFAVTLSGALAFCFGLYTRMQGGLTPSLLMLIGINSFAFGTFVGATGYLDAVLMVLVVAALASPPTAAWGLGVRLGALILGALLHEVMVPYFMMLIAFDIWLAEAGRRRWRALLPVGVGCTMVVLLFTIGEVRPEDGAAIMEGMRSRTGFVPHDVVMNTVTYTLADHSAYTEEYRSRDAYGAMLVCDGLPLGALVFWIWWLGARLLGERRTLSHFVFLLVLLAPLSLNVIAIDVARFFAISALAGFLALGLILVHVPGARQRLSESLSLGHALAVLVLSSNIFTYGFNASMAFTAQAPWVWLEHEAWFSFGAV
ncbi:MAG: hypothetical protein HUJ27_13480 [Rhodobacteraceae bacterium]|nr:hypothetical protein [Paracoccaceae bacterium]